MRRIPHEPPAALVASGQAPVVLKKQVRTNDLDEVEKPVLACPPVLLMIVRVPEAKGIVYRVPML